jgi:hypothetical protein
MTMLEGNMDRLINTPFLTNERTGFFISGEEGYYADHKMPQ